MILLSRIIKSPWIEQVAKDNKTIKIIPFLTERLNEEVVVDVPVNQVDVDVIYQKANDEAELIKSNARKQAEEIKLGIENERDHWHEVERRRLEEEAKELGYNEGYSVGMEQGFAQVHDQIEQAKKIVLQSKEDYKSFLDSSEKTILELSVQIAEKIINHQVQASEETFLNVVKKAIKEARDHQEVQLRVHPKEYENLLIHKDELQGIFPKETNLYIFPDDELSETSCIIESTSGRIDASIDSQLQEIKNKLLELLEGE